MRATLLGDDCSEEFAKNLLKLGEGRVPLDKNNCLDTSLISTSVSSVDELIAKVFPNFQDHQQNDKYLCERAILAPKNITANSINNKLLDRISSDLHIYKSIDSVPDPSQAVNYPVEFLIYSVIQRKAS